jgi:LPXTG-motif cell wall-anchored protein
VQSLGARASDPVTAQFSIAAAEATPSPIPTAPGEGGGSTSGPGSGPGSGSDSAGTAEGSLPATGLDQGLWMSLLALGSALLAAGAAITIRARRRMRG